MNEREITPEILVKYLPVPQNKSSNLPALIPQNEQSYGGMSERDLLHKVLFDMRKDITELKKLVSGIMQGADSGDFHFTEGQNAILEKINNDLSHDPPYNANNSSAYQQLPNNVIYSPQDIHDHEEVEEILSLEEKEKELIKKALEKHRGKRKYAAKELGISERTLYRKIKEYDLK